MFGIPQDPGLLPRRSGWCGGEAATKAQEKCPNLKVAGHQHGFFSPREEDEIIAKINASGARVVFVAFGVPSQDVWLARVRHRLHAPVVLGVGGLLDFVSAASRVRQMDAQTGTEWMYRLKCEPRRMWQRYLVGNCTFLASAAAYALSRRKRSLLQRLIAGLPAAWISSPRRWGFLALSPLLIGTALAIRLESKGPALYRQIRIGENGKPFEIYKFRSMRIDGPSQEELSKQNHDRDDGVTFKLKRDPRITAIGRLIRKFLSMSFRSSERLKGRYVPGRSAPGASGRSRQIFGGGTTSLARKPGITCFWQIQGRADLPFDRQVVLDVRLFAKTVHLARPRNSSQNAMAVLSARGAY